MRTIGRVLATIAIVGSAFDLVPSAFGQAVVENAIKFDVSPPLRTIQPPARPQGAFLREHIVKKIPLPPEKLAALADTALQRRATAQLPVVIGRTFPGVGRENYSIMSDPPDTNGSVSKTHYVQWVNTGLAIFEKATGSRVLGPVDGNLLWTGFGGNCERFNDGDPIVLYDKAADRWLLTQFAVTQAPFSQCIAVSTSPDPPVPMPVTNTSSRISTTIRSSASGPMLITAPSICSRGTH